MARRSTPRRLTKRGLNTALKAVAKRDADVAAALAAHGPPPELRTLPAGFSGLLRIIVGQQVSAAAARAIWARVEAALDPVDAAAFLALGEDGARALGLSRRKVEYGRGVAAATLDQSLDFAALARAPEDAAVARLSALRGLGEWSANIYLLFSLGRPDAWPADDLALQVGAQRLKRLDERPGARAMAAVAETWRPWRGAMAMFLWRYYHVTGGAKQFPDAGPRSAPRPRQD